MPRSFVNGTWTSQVAAKLAESFKDTVKGEILQVLSTAKNEGATDQELEKVLGRPGNTVRPARVDLANKGFVVDSGKWRHTLSQRPAIVWVLTQYAADAE